MPAEVKKNAHAGFPADSAPSECEVSFVVPAYNEARRIVPTLERIRHFAESNYFSWEILVVDDGSRDLTATLVQNYFSTSGCKRPLTLIRNGSNRGKGFSVQQGFLASRGQIVLFTDSDLSAPIEEAPKLIDPIRQGKYHGVIASRAVRGSRIVVHQHFIREYGGKFFNLLVRLLTGLPFHDTQCGFKAFGRRDFLPVFRQQRLEGFAFDVEILYLAKRMGLRVLETPILWSHCADSKVRYFSDSLSMLREIGRIRQNAWKKLYTFSPDAMPPTPAVPSEKAGKEKS
jgi:dolichyl-phosphate beta-glucosyltransferase